ncbi:MAG TPA: hypothetical protein DCQ31_15350 [Bacteroidales bacterium]|nr:hypothetical protein [Bacteroidales bacterium]
MPPEQIHIKLPKYIELNPELLDKLSQLNKRIAVKKRFKHILVLEERKFKFEDYEFVPFKFPPKLFKNNDFDVLYNLNFDFEFEQPGNSSINIRVPSMHLIGCISTAIGAMLAHWCMQNKAGTVLGLFGEYEFNKGGKYVQRF